MRGPRGLSVSLALVVSTARYLSVARALPDGWAGEVLLDPAGNDWEPLVAADPTAPRLYALVPRFGAPCAGRCPDPALFLLSSTDAGETWGTRPAAVPVPDGRPAVGPADRGRTTAPCTPRGSRRAGRGR